MNAPPTIRTAYFTAVPLFPSNNGGALVCRNHIRELVLDPVVDLLVCSVGRLEHEDPNRRAVESLGADYVFLPFRDGRLRPIRRIAGRWPFLLETDALLHPSIDAAFRSLVDAVEAQVVIVDYVPSASYVRSIYSQPVRRVTITLNREGAFYRELSQTGRLPPDASASFVAAARAARFERWVYRKSDAVVALSSGDLPSWRGSPRVREVVPPVFEPSSERWRHTGRRRLFFVGNVAHYPNLHAIEWLATKLAPELEQLDSRIELRVLGAANETVPHDWQRPNIVYLGTGDDATLTSEFVNADLFIAPIANAYGSKIKLLDCVSHATPFVATREALTGLPFLSAVPLIDLALPRDAAELVVALLSQPDALIEASERLCNELDAFLACQAGRWGRLLRSVVQPLSRPRVANESRLRQ